MSCALPGALTVWRIHPPTHMQSKGIYLLTHPLIHPSTYLQGALYTAMHASSYREGVCFSIMAGGDNCSRNVCIGALLGAAGVDGKEGGKGIPQEWTEKTKVYEEVEALSEKIVGMLSVE